MKKDFKILAIESSCDETAAAVIGEKNDQPVVLSNVVSSQIDLHAKTGGVVPEVASRAHVEAIVPVISEALTAAKIELKSIDCVAVTVGPGLVGSLLVGYNAAKTLAYSLNLPIVPINHIEGHIYSAFSEKLNIDFPVLALTVSGGHTSLNLMTGHGKYQIVGQTLDDAAGEAFDKVAKLLDLGYPGGPIVSKLAGEYRSKNKKTNIKFPRPILNNGTFNFSFSGLKTAVLQKVIDIKKEQKLTDDIRREICAAFEDAVVDVLTTKTVRAAEKYEPKIIILAGGVAANSFLRNKLTSKIENLPAGKAGLKSNIKFLPAPINLCGDNAAMIGLAAFYHVLSNDTTTWDKTEVDSNLEL